MSLVAQYQTGPQVGIRASQAWYVDLKIKKRICGVVNGYWRVVMVVVLHSPGPHLNLVIDLFQPGQEVGDALPLAIDDAIRAAEVQA